MDLHYRLHWATNEAHVRGAPLDPDVEAGVVIERHDALNWHTHFQRR